MERYTETLKNKVVAKLLPPESASVSAIAKEIGVTVQQVVNNSGKEPLQARKKRSLRFDGLAGGVFWHPPHQALTDLQIA